MHGANIHSHKYESERSYMIVPRHLIATYYYDDVQQIFGILQLTFLELAWYDDIFFFISVAF